MYVTWQTIITAGAVLGALITICGALLAVHKWYLKQEKQSSDIESLKKHHDDDVSHINEENALICYALSACLDGLIQLGANHTVPIAKEKLDKYLNNRAHK